MGEINRNGILDEHQPSWGYGMVSEIRRWVGGFFLIIGLFILGVTTLSVAVMMFIPVFVGIVLLMIGGLILP